MKGGVNESVRTSFVLLLILKDHSPLLFVLLLSSFFQSLFVLVKLDNTYETSVRYVKRYK